MQAPSVVGTNATAIEFTWSRPSQPNAAMVSYEIEVRQASNQMLVATVFFNDSRTFEAVVSQGLAPSTSYELRLVVSNRIGQTTSDRVTTVTADGSK